MKSRLLSPKENRNTKDAKVSRDSPNPDSGRVKYETHIFSCQGTPSFTIFCGPNLFLLSLFLPFLLIL
jgi:hypothetical protein